MALGLPEPIRSDRRTESPARFSPGGAFCCRSIQVAEPSMCFAHCGRVIPARALQRAQFMSFAQVAEASVLNGLRCAEYMCEIRPHLPGLGAANKVLGPAPDRPRISFSSNA